MLHLYPFGINEIGCDRMVGDSLINKGNQKMTAVSVFGVMYRRKYKVECNGHFAKEMDELLVVNNYN